MDLSTPRAIAAAKKAGLADLGLADVFVSQLAPEGSTVFTPYHLGRAFTILRHPVKLATSLFYYRRIAHWEPSYRPEYQNITLQELVETEGYYDNWMVVSHFFSRFSVIVHRWRWCLGCAKVIFVRELIFKIVLLEHFL